MSFTKGRKDEIAAVTADELRSQLVLKKMVGRGGFAAVFFGTYKGQEVAVKVILAEHASPESLQVKLLLREGQYMSRCTHKNIIKCHAVCQLPGNFPGIEALGHRSSTWALVLEYVGGGSLAALMLKQMSQNHKAYTDYEAYCWVRDVAEALSYLHNAPRPVMHRDVKADNVLLTVDETGRPTAKLMDFGLMAALDQKNPMLRRRSVGVSVSVAASPGIQGGDGHLGRCSATPIITTSVARGSMGAGCGGGAGRNLSAPSVATYYNDSTHEPGKIFYLMDELPAPTVAALPGPAALRRVSVDVSSLGGSASTATTPLGFGPNTLSSATSPAAAASQYGFTVAASRVSSLDCSGGGGGGAASPTAGGGSSAGGGGGGSAATALGMAWGPKTRSGLMPATTGSFGTLVPLNEEASYHGNTAGYAAMLLHQQEKRREEQRQRWASQDAAPGPPGGGGGGAISAVNGADGGGLSNSLHGRATTGPVFYSGGSFQPDGASPLEGRSPLLGISPIPGASPVPSAKLQRDGLATGSVQLRLFSEETPSAATVGGGGDAIAMAAARLGLQVTESNGTFLRMSAPQPMPTTPQPTGPSLVEDESPPRSDPSGLILREPTIAANAATAAASMHGTQHREDPHNTHNQQQQQGSQLRASRPSKLPPIIAVAKHAHSAAIAAGGGGGGPSSSSSALPDCNTAPGGGGGGGGQDETGTSVTTTPTSAGAAAAAAAATTAVAASGLGDLHCHLTGFGGCVRERRASYNDAVPMVATGDSGPDGVLVLSAAMSRRPRSGLASSCTQITIPLLQTGVHAAAQVVPPLLSPQGEGTVLGNGGGGGGGGAASGTSPLVDRQLSQKSISSNRSGTGNGYARCSGGDGGGGGGGALTAVGGGGGGGGGALTAVGGGGGQFSITALLQGRYEQDFQWVWRLTGQTGSCMYMAPEVYRNMPYNEKVDVFSFGVLLYEIFSRTLTLVAGLNLRELRLKGMNTPEGYAQHVAEGYRPPKPLAMPQPLYELISACWADDPCARPNMADVVETLRLLQEQYAPEPTSSAPSCGCAIS